MALSLFALSFPFLIFENKSFASWTKFAPLLEASAALPVAMAIPTILAGTPVASSPTPTPASVPPPTIPPTFPTFIS